jgi:hypothetical protein
MIVFDNFMRNALKRAADFAGIKNCSHFLSFAASLDGSLKELLCLSGWEKIPPVDSQIHFSSPVSILAK